jgi:hypothetical protein
VTKKVVGVFVRFRAPLQQRDLFITAVGIDVGCDHRWPQACILKAYDEVKCVGFSLIVFDEDVFTGFAQCPVSVVYAEKPELVRDQFIQRWRNNRGARQLRRWFGRTLRLPAASPWFRLISTGQRRHSWNAVNLKPLRLGKRS